MVSVKCEKIGNPQEYIWHACKNNLILSGTTVNATEPRSAAAKSEVQGENKSAEDDEKG